jgi:hypothetical protein
MELMDGGSMLDAMRRWYTNRRLDSLPSLSDVRANIAKDT